jgi:hypothetical protein
MKRRTLAIHKREAKVLTDAPVFSQMKRGKLPKPLDKVGGPRIHMTPLIEVAPAYSVWFMWKDGDTLMKTAFYAYLFHHVGNGNLYPLCHFHWHPSHKPIHFTSPCDSDLNYTNRGLPSGKELNLRQFIKPYDPRRERDRLQLI